MFCDVAKEFGLTVSLVKTKFLVAGVAVTLEDQADIIIDGSSVQCVSDFPYLGSLVTADTRTSHDTQRRIRLASQAFGALRPVFTDHNLSMRTKRQLFSACILSILLYGSECWTPLSQDLKQLDQFHHRCLRAILAVSRQDQWDHRISNENLRQAWGT